MFDQPLWAKLSALKHSTKVSLVELFPGSGVQYARSSGTFAKVLKFNINNYTCVLRLPSGVRKAFSFFSLCFLGPVSLRNKRLIKNTRSGYWRNFGVKAKTRGVAMNPIDHPHGGRTKSIKNQRTP